MKASHKVLVVDDEEVVCASCTRILAKEGYRVEACTDSQEGLRRAVSADYDAILLDIKMERLDGVEFLGLLRQEKPDVPVIIITGYPTEENAAASLRLGASDYILKPFGPEEITESVRSVLDRPANAPAVGAPAATAKAVPASPARAAKREAFERGFRFHGEAWFEAAPDGTARAGAFLPRDEYASATLPRVGEAVHQGLPLAAFTARGKPPRVVPSPLTGTVVEVNAALAAAPAATVSDPCTRAWIARIEPSALDEEKARCPARRVVLVNGNEARAGEQRAELERLGCAVEVRRAAGDSGPSDAGGLFVLDAAWLGSAGPGAVAEIRRSLPDAKVVIVAAPGAPVACGEAAYRERGIYYYAVEPFADGEIIDILAAAFAPPPRPAPHEEETVLMPKTMNVLRITNRRGTKVSIVALGDILAHDTGLGLRLVRRILDAGYPLETVRNFAHAPFDQRDAASAIFDEARRCERLFILRLDDRGAIPGTLSIGAKGAWQAAAGAPAAVTVLGIQQAASPAGPLAFDDRTIEALAAHTAGMMEAA